MSVSLARNSHSEGDMLPRATPVRGAEAEAKDMRRIEYNTI